MDAKQRQPKDEPTVVVSVMTRICYREHKYPDGDPRRACHIGLQKIDVTICQHCTWLGSADNKPLANLDGDSIPKFLAALKRVQQDEAAPVPAAG